MLEERGVQVVVDVEEDTPSETAVSKRKKVPP